MVKPVNFFNLRRNWAFYYPNNVSGNVRKEYLCTWFPCNNCMCLLNENLWEMLWAKLRIFIKNVFNACPFNVAMWFKFEYHCELVWANIMCQFIYVRNIFFYYFPGNVSMCLLREVKWEYLRFNVILSIIYLRNVLLFSCPGNVLTFYLPEWQIICTNKWNIIREFR